MANPAGYNAANARAQGGDQLLVNGSIVINGTATPLKGAAASAFVVDAPAGGTGATAGAYDTAANRNQLIATVNAMKACLIAHGLMAAS